MAWSDQCKISFGVTVKAKKATSPRKRSDASVIREISKESGVPFSTLKRWWYEFQESEDKKRVKNEPKSEPADTISLKPQNENVTVVDEPKTRTCINGCGKPVALHTETGRPYGETSKFYGLCIACVSKVQRSVARQKKLSDETGETISCPHCGRSFLITKK